MFYSTTSLRINERLSHLPADPAGQILDDEPVLGARRGPVSVPRAHVGLAPSGGAAAAPAPQVRPLGYPAGPLDGDPLPEQFPPVQLVYGVVGIPVVVELDEGEPVLHRDLPDLAVLPEKPLQVALTDPVSQAPHEHPAAHFAASLAQTGTDADRERWRMVRLGSGAQARSGMGQEVA